MARTLEDKVERLEDWVMQTVPVLALIQKAQEGVTEREQRLDDLEKLVSWLKGAAWVIGTLFAAGATLVSIWLMRGS